MRLTLPRSLLLGLLVVGVGSVPTRAQDADPAPGDWRTLSDAGERHARGLDAARALRAAGDAVGAARILEELVADGAGVEAERELGLARLDFARQVLARGESGMSIKAAFEDARIALTRAYESGATDELVHRSLAYACNGLGETQERLRWLARGRKAHPDSTELVRAHAFALLDAGDDASAVMLFEPLSAELPEDATLARALSYTARRANRPDLARTGAERAIAAEPDQGEGWLSLWQLYAPDNRYGELADALVALAEAYPDSAVGAHYAGFACSNARRLEPALEWLARAHELDPANVVAQTEIARIHRDETGEEDRAAEIYLEVLAEHPGAPEALVGLGFLAQRHGSNLEHERALPLFEALAQAQPDDGQAWANLALARRWTGRYEAADEAYRRAVENTPNDAQIWNDYGLLLLVMQRDADAARIFRTAGEVDERHNDGSENLAFMARERGDREDTERWFRDAWERAMKRGEDGARHRRNLDDTRWPLPPLKLGGE